MIKIIERFSRKFIKTVDGCWNWTAAIRGKSGYGCIRYNKKIIDAHRMSYLLFRGEIPPGMCVLHKCDNRLCVNPEHLFLGTYKDNYDDAIKKGRIDPHAHKLSRNHPNISSYKLGCRCELCREIQKLRMRKYRKSKKECVV